MYKASLSSGDGAGGVFSLVNPEGIDLIIKRVILNVTTKSTAGCTVDVGVAATSISNDTLLDGLDVGTATGIFDNIENQGTNGDSCIPWPTGYYLTATKATGAAAGLVGNIQVEYVAAT